jgi:hypothetical protein
VIEWAAFVFSSWNFSQCQIIKPEEGRLQLTEKTRRENELSLKKTRRQPRSGVTD